MIKIEECMIQILSSTYCAVCASAVSMGSMMQTTSSLRSSTVQLRLPEHAIIVSPCHYQFLTSHFKMAGMGGFGGMGGMSGTSMAQQDEMRLMQMMQEMQMADSLRMYNELVERCFGECVDSFRSRKLDGKEVIFGVIHARACLFSPVCRCV